MATLISLHPPLSTYFPESVHQPTASKPQNGSDTPSALPEIARPTSTAERWASYVLGACKSARDPRTLGIWARQVAVSYTTLCESCRLIDVQPRYARDFARVLRILLMPTLDYRQLASFLDVSDKRTLDSILQKAGFGQQQATVADQVSIAYFLDNQQFIAHRNPGLSVIRSVVATA